MFTYFLLFLLRLCLTEIKERQRGDKRIKRALVGSELIDWLISNNVTVFIYAACC